MQEPNPFLPAQEPALIPAHQRQGGAAEATGDALRPRVRPVAPPAPPGPSILVVDDNAGVRASLRLLLEEMGLEIAGEAADGAAAVRAAQAIRPDVILMDWRMPGLDGLEATRRIMRLGLGTRVVMVTAFASPGCEEQARSAGAVALVAKGEHPGAILDAIERAWREHSCLGDADTSSPCSRHAVHPR
jgi:CheY-like chemotaxis protein